MTDYNDGMWHGWLGGLCPVHEKSIVRAVFGNIAHRSGDDLTGQWIEREAGQFQSRCWQNQIEAFRVVKEYRQPREFWVEMYGEYPGALHKTKADALASSPRVILVREVMEDEA